MTGNSTNGVKTVAVSVVASLLTAGILGTVAMFAQQNGLNVKLGDQQRQIDDMNRRLRVCEREYDPTGSVSNGHTASTAGSPKG